MHSTAPEKRRVWRFRALTAAMAFGAALSVACGGAGTAQSEEDITDIPHTPVKHQSIGNCWLYASVGWAESLHLQATGEQRNLSESYYTYWHWYDQLVDSTRGEISTGGWFSSATDLMNHYGMVDEEAFIEGEVNDAKSLRQKSALDHINAALKPASESSDPFAGRLEKRSDRTAENVRAVLSDAWELSEDVRRDLDAAFGPGAPRRLDTTDERVPERFTRTRDFLVRHKDPGAAESERSLYDEISAWEEVYVSSYNQRGTFRRVQKALHDSQPALMVWHVDWESRTKSDGTFRKLEGSNEWDGAHMTVLEDYQVAKVPNYGTLPAGVLVTDEQALQAALTDQAEIQFFRIKNSWGDTPDPTGENLQFKGYMDLYRDYLVDYHALTSFILPRAYDAEPPTGIVDACSLPAASQNGLYCVGGITGDAGDKRLVDCEGEVSMSGQVCETACEVMASGTPDSCTNGGGQPLPPPPNPCENANGGIGPYCGSSLGLAPSDPGYGQLYQCQKDINGNWISPSSPCPSGCNAAPPGYPDTCN